MTSGPAAPQVAESLARAGETLAEAKAELARRESRKVIRLAHLACFHAAAALWRATDLSPVWRQDDYDLDRLLAGSSAKSLAAFYRRLGQTKRRLDEDAKSQVHVEEAAVWLRQAAHFVDRLAGLCRPGRE